MKQMTESEKICTKSLLERKYNMTFEMINYQYIKKKKSNDKNPRKENTTCRFCKRITTRRCCKCGRGVCGKHVVIN